MGIAGRAFAVVRMTGQMRFVCISRIVVRQFVFAVVVRFVSATAGAMLVPMIVSVVMTVVVIVIVCMLMSMVVPVIVIVIV